MTFAHYEPEQVGVRLGVWAGERVTGWPELALAAWEDTRDTLHLWTQVVGKVRLALEPALNHTWQAPLYVSARGLTTSLMPYDGRGVEMEFDFHRHVLDIRTTDGGERQVRLEARSVADFYAETMARLDDSTCRS